MLWLKRGVEWAPGSTLVLMPEVSVGESWPEVQEEVAKGAGEELLSGIVRGETVEGEDVLEAKSWDKEPLVSTKGTLVLDSSSRPLLLRVITCDAVNP